jgi:hypothetical protein
VCAGGGVHQQPPLVHYREVPAGTYWYIGEQDETKPEAVGKNPE